MKKLLLATTISGTLLLGACGNTSSSEDKSSNLEPEKQEEIYKKETKKLGQVLLEDSEDGDVTKESTGKLQKSIDRYESKTKNLDDVETEIGDHALRIAKTAESMSKRMNDLEKFKKDNPDKEKSYDLAAVDAAIHTGYTLDSINSDYEQLDIAYKNEYLGKKANEEITDILSLFPAYELEEMVDGYGVLVIEYDEDLNNEQLKVLSNTEYREELKEAMITEEPDTSKNDYNESVNMFNKFAPEFLHYKEVDKLVSSTEDSNMMSIRNAVVSANTDAGVDSYEDAEEEVEEDIDSVEEGTEEETSDEEYDTGGWSAESYNELVDEYNSLTDGEKMDHVDDDVLDIEYEQLEERVAKLEAE
ncbi:hypothetical protein [Staphylococcus equorum]|uniref:Uncharacterized protein n=1 Tax=Staphylococcus equorum TaxID=246432 RepID=A0A9X4R2K7_9STAP|nr:hypothetical protein [Staphylococcus equorum]MDG0860340.1 hypothetical protein [Staphylococcus equorum]